MTKSKILLLVIIIVASLLLFSPINPYMSTGSHITIMSRETNKSTEKSMSYNKFSGTKNYTLKVKDPREKEITINFVSESGYLKATVTNSSGNIVFEKDNIETSSYKIAISNSNKYKIRVEAKDHRGSYSFKIQL